MQTDTIVIGQGLSGTWLTYWLHKLGLPFVLIDDQSPITASKVASGIINPVTGRRMVKTWLADQLIPFAADAYQELSLELGENLITQIDVLDFFNAPDRRISFEQRATQFEDYLNWPEDEHAWLEWLNYPFGFGIISPAYKVEIKTLLTGWKKKLEEKNYFYMRNTIRSNWFLKMTR